MNSSFLGPLPNNTENFPSIFWRHRDLNKFTMNKRDPLFRYPSKHLFWVNFPIKYWRDNLLPSPLCLSVCLSVCLSIYLSICLSICLSVYLSIYLSVWSVCLSVYLSVYLSVCLSVCLYICLSICLSVLSVCLSICLSVCLSICLSVYDDYPFLPLSFLSCLASSRLLFCFSLLILKSLIFFFHCCFVFVLSFIFPPFLPS